MMGIDVVLLTAITTKFQDLLL